MTGPTVVRGSMLVSRPVHPSTPWTMFSITGRKVMSLQPGANDIRHVAPGVYFVRSAESGERSAATKVVVHK